MKVSKKSKMVTCGQGGVDRRADDGGAWHTLQPYGATAEVRVRRRCDAVRVMRGGAGVMHECIPCV